jgi:hypothetical protein
LRSPSCSPAVDALGHSEECDGAPTRP